ncbi:AAA domain (dynein-related subfamily) [Cetobacterium ceti]|uniref:AAA domain (Dynein-related subfamily) n=1 Tax=Cetobacterium ceti TaxID=180163 RepID=A0A1T4QLZ5_9FUSO|nr:AAA family ATPase [Cetobacterium ceti]SKA04762.1 AAA domain (dynein-related subfamily) [Cetobacterium ceti]
MVELSTKKEMENLLVNLGLKDIINSNEIEAILVKKMADSNILIENKVGKGNQTHIAFTAKERAIFPTVSTLSYIENEIDKKFYDIKLKIRLYKENLKILEEKSNIKLFDFENQYIETFAMCYVRKDNDDIQIQLSKINSDDENFINFRRLIYKDDYIIFIKLKYKLEFICWGLNKDCGIIENNDNILYIEKTSNKVTNLKNEDIIFSNERESVNIEYQKIVFGAPGTGKSHDLNIQIKEIFKGKEAIKRVTFYDGYTYGQFVGAYKPMMYPNKQIGYSFVPGPLLEQIANAYKFLESDFILVIEEINRAKVDRVFGDIFQLLDRNKEGESEYPISLSKEQNEYFLEVLGEEKYNDTIKKKAGLYFPRNLYIWATMNNADQGVYPMDTAFKRRWDFEYKSLNEKENEINKDYKINIDGIDYNWNIYRNIINEVLENEGINEDRLISPFFIKNKDFDKLTNYILYNPYVNKFLMYLYEDILKYNPHLKEKIFIEKNFYRTLDKLKNNEDIYTNYFKQLLEEKIIILNTEEV